ncbi:hypothetical protein LI168_03205 [Desulfovibrio desulfuricans]|uniref:hypothetical protein n=1 Tax=Desulfovibrio desulfuricans TaxID=876 RepID=UPI001D067070|nr:hypothetical protein [Desulfovibrio desulfuricans]MCB6541144.1 hypothetical protein [Desulfovibrio desulfuricans]MCB6552226.1 hypothetical protein [Desulfovibrio desulfuricans]MCB6564069.1 hypothetical protein [Desulfovibrio desulfuricans]MCB7345249.1 hypothetical protein [Desulfovibrio desulfuricans]MCQ5217298.1 hypothetical protein [Desulfovibrio desulfuricans]
MPTDTDPETPAISINMDWNNPLVTLTQDEVDRLKLHIWLDNVTIDAQIISNNEISHINK